MATKRALLASWPSPSARCFSNQHIPRSPDRHRETVFGSALSGWGNVHILSPDLRLHTCTVTVLFCSFSHSKHHILTLNVHSFFLLFGISCYSQSFSPESFSFLYARRQLQSQCGRANPCLLLCPTNKDSLLSALMTVLPLSFHLSLFFFFFLPQ